eukprot:m.46114 g.46114  ORF g.46114 m.46114 type:complete len:433 (-) comp10336_c0_seq1:81-1379(-)
MGQGFSSGNSVWVQTDKPTYFVGDQVHGTIYLNCLTTFPCRGLHITLEGEEKTHWIDIHTETRWRDGPNGRESYEHREERPRHGRREFFCVKVPVYNFAGQVMPGQYSFPFSFQLPPGLPGIIEARLGNNNQTRGSIYYTVTGECDIAGFLVNTEIKHSQNIVVLQRLQGAITNTMNEAQESVTCCCCVNKGSAHLKAHLDKNAYAPGEIVNILCNIENNSEEGFNKVRVELVRSLTLRDNHGHTHTSSNTVSRNDYRGVGPQEVRGQNNPLSLPLQLSSDLWPSVQGQLIQCSYIVDVVFVADGTFVRNLHVRVPVTIYAPQPPATVFVQQAPAGWNPQKMPSVQVQLPAAPSAPPPSQYPPQPQYGDPNASDRTPLIQQQPGGQYGGTQQQYPPQQYAQQPAAPQYGQQQQPPQYGQQQQQFDPMTGKPL